MNKKEYTQPKLELLKFSAEDVMITSLFNPEASEGSGWDSGEMHF